MIRKEILELEFSDALITIYKYLNERGRVLIEGDPNGIELTPQEMIDFGHEIAAMGYDLIEADDVDIDDSKEEEEWKVGDRIRIKSNGQEVLVYSDAGEYYGVINSNGWLNAIKKEEGEKIYE